MLKEIDKLIAGNHFCRNCINWNGYGWCRFNKKRTKSTDYCRWHKGLILIPEAHPDKYEQMPPGLDGYWWETDKVICVPFVENRNEGDGSFSKWLSELESKGKIIFFPAVISGRLEFILRKRGFSDAITDYMDKDFECHIEGLAKRCSQEVMELNI